MFDRPAGLGDYNNEGFAIAPQALCGNGLKPVVWSDDDETDGYALRQGTIACAAAPVPASESGTSTGGSDGGKALAGTGIEPVVPVLAALLLLAAGAATALVRRRRA